jgi:hypothetical protein
MSDTAEDKVAAEIVVRTTSQIDIPQYRLYRQRFLGLAGFVSEPVVSLAV